MPNVRAKENEPFEATYRRFRRSVEKANVLAELRRRAHHQKRSEVRKRNKLAAKKRELKRISRERMSLSRDRKRHGAIAPQIPLVGLSEQVTESGQD